MYNKQEEEFYTPPPLFPNTTEADYHLYPNSYLINYNLALY